MIFSFITDIKGALSLGKIDIGSKRIIHLYNQAWIEWTLQQPVQVESELSGEFQFVMRDSDSLIKVKSPQGSFLSLTELQFKYDDAMPERVAAYAALAREKYHLKVFVTVVYFLRPPKNRTVSNTFHQELMGQTVHQDFKIISLWELDAKQALIFNNPAVLPFVPLMKGGNTVEMVQICAKRLGTEEHAEELKAFLAILASYVLDKQLVNQILRLNMEIIEQSPLMQDLLERKCDEAREKGMEDGMEKGLLNALWQLLTFRFEISREYFNRHFQALELKTIEQLYKTALRVQNLTEFEEALDTTSSKAKKDL